MSRLRKIFRAAGKAALAGALAPIAPTVSAGLLGSGTKDGVQAVRDDQPIGGTADPGSTAEGVRRGDPREVHVTDPIAVGMPQGQTADPLAFGALPAPPQQQQQRTVSVGMPEAQTAEAPRQVIMPQGQTMAAADPMSLPTLQQVAVPQGQTMAVADPLTLPPPDAQDPTGHRALQTLTPEQQAAYDRNLTGMLEGSIYDPMAAATREAQARQAATARGALAHQVAGRGLSQHGMAGQLGSSLDSRLASDRFADELGISQARVGTQLQGMGAASTLAGASEGLLFRDRAEAIAADDRAYLQNLDALKTMIATGGADNLQQASELFSQVFPGAQIDFSPLLEADEAAKYNAVAGQMQNLIASLPPETPPALIEGLATMYMQVQNKAWERMGIDTGALTINDGEGNPVNVTDIVDGIDSEVTDALEGGVVSPEVGTAALNIGKFTESWWNDTLEGEQALNALNTAEAGRQLMEAFARGDADSAEELGRYIGAAMQHSMKPDDLNDVQKELLEKYSGRKTITPTEEETEQRVDSAVVSMSVNAMKEALREGNEIVARAVYNDLSGGEKELVGDFEDFKDAVAREEAKQALASFAPDGLLKPGDLNKTGIATDITRLQYDGSIYQQGAGKANEVSFVPEVRRNIEASIGQTMTFNGVEYTIEGVKTRHEIRKGTDFRPAQYADAVILKGPDGQTVYHTFGTVVQVRRTKRRDWTTESGG